MRMFVAFFAVMLLISNSFAYCSSNTGNPIYNCGAGRFFDTETNQCADCPAGYYCAGNGIAYCCNTNTNGNFPESAALSESMDACYTNINCYKHDGGTEQCKRYSNNTIGDCPSITEPHLEDNICYAKTRLCSLFAHENCETNQISGNATWFETNNSHGWNVSSCTCGGGTFESTDYLFCHGVNGGSRPSVSTAVNANTTLNFNYPTGDYYCTRCILDNGNDKYYADTEYSNDDQCSPDTSQGRICKCETNNDKGWWRRGTCNSNTDWTDENSICQRVACGAGKTTTDILPTQESSCHFGDRTNICDDNGCKKLQEVLSGISAQQWTYSN